MTRILTSQVAELLGVSETRVRQMAGEGKLKGKREPRPGLLGEVLTFDSAQVEAFRATFVKRGEKGTSRAGRKAKAAPA